MKKFVYPCLLAILLMPVLIFLHECGHFVVASAYGAGPEFRLTHVIIADGYKTEFGRFCGKAAGPLVDALIAVGGFLWLRRRHGVRGDAPAGLPDWVATIFVLRATDSILGFVVALTRGAVPLDGVQMSVMLGWPPWLLPGFFAVLALALITTALRLLPRGSRLLPVVGIYLGAVLGVTAEIAALYLCTGYFPDA
jgi:hypothetical protein